jgi:hypothetical protein
LKSNGRGETSKAGADNDCGGTSRCDHGEDATRVRRRMRSRLSRGHQTKC